MAATAPPHSTPLRMVKGSDGAPPAARLKRMQRRFRLQRASEFQRVRRHGKSHAHPLAVVVVAPSGELSSRIGITASRAMGTAVRRNRARRRLRAALRLLLPSLRPGFDLVITARRPLLEASWVEVCEVLRLLLQRAGCMADGDEPRG